MPAIVWLGLIVIESTAGLSAANTSRVLYPLLHFLFKLDPVQFLTWHMIIRKTGHVIGYAVLSVLLFRAWRATLQVRNYPRWSIVWARVSFAMTVLVASLDEWHQSFIPSRTGNIRDVFLDSAAALGAQIVLYLWLRRSGDDKPDAAATSTPLRAYSESRTSTPVAD